MKQKKKSKELANVIALGNLECWNHGMLGFLKKNYYSSIPLFRQILAQCE
jgi:hypothetical protein